MASSSTRFFDHTRRRATVGRNPLGQVINSSQRPLPDNTQQTNIHDPGGIRTHDRSRRAAVDPRVRPRGHWDRRSIGIPVVYSYIFTSSMLYSAKETVSQIHGRFLPVIIIIQQVVHCSHLPAPIFKL
jgi:hypothetical protein